MEYHFYCKLKKLLEDRGLSQKEFARRTKMREATISELCNNNRNTFNKKHLVTIMKALDLKELSELIEVVRYEERRKPIAEDREE